MVAGAGKGKSAPSLASRRAPAGTFKGFPRFVPNRCRSGLVVEQRLGKAQVGGSIPPCGSTIPRSRGWGTDWTKSAGTSEPSADFRLIVQVFLTELPLQVPLLLSDHKAYCGQNPGKKNKRPQHVQGDRCP